MAVKPLADASPAARRAPDSAFLALRGVSKSHGPTRAIADVDLDIGPGELVTLLGPSGSGKTTVLMAVAGFVEPDAGEIWLAGRSLRAVPPYRRNVGVVFQQYALFPHLTVADNVAYPLAVRGVPRDEQRRAVAGALELVRLGGLADRYPRQLSGGQQQRVALARALVFRPPVLLMDEPLGALDRNLRAEMQLEIRAIQRQLGVTTVYVTHDQEEALTLSDRIAVVHEGRIAQLGTPREVYERPRDAFVARFLGDSNLLEGMVVGTQPGRLAVRAGDLLLHVRATEELRDRDRVQVLLRPERIRLLPGSAAPQHLAVVEQVLYVGAVVRLSVRVAGQRLLVMTPPHAVPEGLAPGDSVGVGWDDGAPMLLPAEFATRSP
jgi:putative spermidine/putrescine transport system ATP-binding protein